MVIYPLIWVKFYFCYFLNVKRSHWSPPPHLPRDPHPPQLQGKVHHHQPQSSSWRSSHNTLALRENQFLTQLTSSSKIGIGWDLWAGLCNYYNADNKSNLDDPHLALGSAWSASNFRSASSPSSNRCLDLANLPPPPPPPAHYRFHNHICGAWSQWFAHSKISWEVYEKDFMRGIWVKCWIAATCHHLPSRSTRRDSQASDLESLRPPPPPQPSDQLLATTCREPLHPTAGPLLCHRKAISRGCLRFTTGPLQLFPLTTRLLPGHTAGLLLLPFTLPCRLENLEKNCFIVFNFTGRRRGQGGDSHLPPWRNLSVASFWLQLAFSTNREVF